MRKILWLFAALNCCLAYGQAPPWQWARDANSPGSEYGWDVVCDTNSASVYVGGKFNGNLSAKFGASFSSSYGSDDGFLAKYTDAGTFLWAVKIGGTNEDEVRSVGVDPSGNVYVSGTFKGTADFDPTATAFNLTSNGGLDGFLAKYSSAGALLWAVKYGGGADDESWKMYADGSGIFVTGYYSTAPATFSSFSSGITKTTVSNAGGASEMFGAKYNSSGVVQWAISGGGNKIDCGYSVVADASNVYFIGGYGANANFRDASGTSQTMLQAQQNNREQVFIVAYDQSGNFAWQNNITCTTSKDVIGYTIAQDATSLYVSGYMEDDVINFQYPSPVFTQSISGGGSALDIFLAKLSKTGTFTWRAAVTGSGAGEQIGRALEVNSDGDVVLSGNFKNSLNYSSAGGPVLTASAFDIFVAAYSNAGAFKWAVKAGNTGDDVVNGTAAGKSRSIYITGDHASGAAFGSFTLTTGGSDNIYVAKLGCDALANNTITATQTICAGSTPSALSGSVPTGSGPYAYTWQQSADNSAWVTASGTFTNQNYSPAALSSSTYYRRLVTVTGACSATLASTSILISVDQVPTVSAAGSTQTLCTSSATLAGNTPTTGSGLWTVNTGTATLTNPSSATSAVNGLSIGTNRFVWTISNGTCPSSSSTVTIVRDANPTVANAGTSQTLCASSATLAGNTPSTGSGLWTVNTGTATITNPSSAGTGVNGLSIGTNRFVWTISNGTCPSSSSTVTVTRDANPTVSNAGTSQTLCTSSAILSGNTPTTGSGLWTVASGTSTVSNPSSANSAVNGLSVGTNNFIWTISNGTCPSSSSTVTIVRDANPTTANAGTSQTLCTSSATLSGNTPSTGSGLWSVATGTATVSNPSSAGSAVNGLSVGNNNFIWTISNGTCPSSSSTVTVTRDANPTVSNAGTSQTLCTSSATLSGNTPSTGTGLWTVGSGTSTVSNPSSASSAVNGLSVGTNNFIWTISNGTCPSSSSTVTIVRDANPTVSNAGTSQTLCTSSATLAGNTPTTGNGLWTVSAGTATVTNPSSAGSAVNGLSVGINNFIWTISNGTCPSSSSTVTVTRDANPTVANAGSSQTLCTSSATLSGNTPSTGTGFWSIGSGTATVSNPSSASSAVNGLSVGTNNFIWTISNGTCPSSSSTVTVTRDANPTVSNAGTSQTLCTSSAILSGNTPSTGTGLWSVVSGTATVTNPSSAGSAVNGLSVGSNNFIWTISNGTCPSSSSTVTVTRDANPTVANAGNTQTLCTSSATLSGNTPSTGTGLWTVGSGTATVSNPSSAGSAVNGLSVGINNFIWTISNGTCPSSSSTVTVTRDANPTVSNAGTSQTLCTSSATLAGNIPTTGSGLWTVASGTSTVSNPSSAGSAVNGLSVGTNNFIWTISNGTCPSSSSTVTVTRDANPTVSNAGTSQTLCTSSATLSGNTPTTGSGLWSVATGTATVSNPSSAGSAVNGLSIGTNNFVWTISNGTCPSSSSTVTIVRDANPTTANAGTSQTLCTSSATLAGNTPSTGTGLWSVGSGTATVSNPSSAGSAVNGLSVGTNNFIWTISNGTCPSSSSTVTITRDANPTVSNAGTSQTLCTSSATLAGNTPSTGTGLWTVGSGTSTVSNPSSANSAVNGLSIGTNNFVWTISNGTCPSSSSTVTITRDANPTVANAGTSQTLCTSSATLSGNIPSTGTGLWSVSSGTATVSNPSSVSTAVNGLNVGANDFVWTISNGTCPSSSSTVTVTRDDNPTIANAGNTQTLCTSSATLAGNAPSTGTGLWSVASGTSTVSNPSSAGSTVNGLNVGTNDFIWTISNGTCPSSSSTVTITRDANPTVANAGNTQTLCTSSATLAGNTPSIGTGLWTVSIGTATVSNPSSVSTAVNGLNVGANDFVWTISNGTCPSSSSTVTVTRDANPTTANAGTSQTLCTSSATLAGNTPAVGTGFWSVNTGTATISNSSSAGTAVNGLSVGANDFVWTISNGTCPSSSSTVTVMRDPNPTVANAGTSQTLCTSSATLSGNTPLTGTGLWSVSIGTATVSNPSSVSTAVNGLNVGANDFVWTISNGTCPSSSSTVTVTRDDNPTIANAGNTQTLCTSSATLAGNAPSTGTGLWSVSTGTATVSNPSSAGSTVNGLNVGTNDFIWTISNGTCPSSSSTVTITRDANPTTANAGTSQTLCASSATLAGNAPSTGTGLWSVGSGTATVSNPSSESSAVNGLSTGGNNFIWTISNGTCPSSASTVTIVQDLPPTASAAGSSQTVCASSASLSANIPSTGTGAWSVVSGNASFSALNNPAAVASGLPNGQTILAWTISSGVCAASTSTVSVYREAAPTNAAAGIDQAVCAATATLNANIPTVGSGLWSVAQGTATVSQPNASSTSVSLTTGQNVFVWSITNGICPVSRDTVIIVRDELPTPANAGTDQLICSTTSSLNANIPVTGSGSWTSLSGNGFSSPSQALSQVTGLNTGTNTVIWSITNGSCPASRDTVIIRVDAQPSNANAGADIRICSDVVNLAAIPPLTGTGSWRILSGSASISDTSLYNASLSAVSAGTTTLLWTTRNGVCADKTDELIVLRDLMPDTAKAGDDQATDYPVAILTANSPRIGTGFWTVTTGSAELDNPTDFKTQAKLSEGENAFRWTIVNGSCPSSSDEVMVMARPMAVPNAFSPNNDGINDTFVIPGIDYYDGIKLQVFNRWGAPVYTNSNYKNDWAGLNSANEAVADDTYYYTLEMTSGKTLTGFIIVKRSK